jgi:uncharacterized tellurite resistance protein B-like protein
MIDAIKQFFSTELVLDNQADPQHQLQLACAALLIELSRADFQQDDEERQAIERLLEQRFSLDSDQLNTLISLAEQENRESTSLYQFTSLINEHYSPDQKYQMVVLLWEVALADGQISKYEDHLIRKISELIYLPHSEFIRAKIAVRGDQRN